MPTAESGAPWQLRTALSIYGFQQSDYLIQGDKNAQMQGTLHLSATLGRQVEAFVLVGIGSNRNDRAGRRTDDALLLSLGDVGLGLKLHGSIGRGFALGLQPIVGLRSGLGSQGPNWTTTSLGADALVSYDLQRAVRWLPVKLHGLVGFMQDRSSALLEQFSCGQELGAVECANSRLVTGAAYGVRYPRMRLGLGATAAWQPASWVALGPLFEYHLEVVTGDGDGAIREALRGRTTDDLLNNRVQQWLALGARVATAANLTLDLGVDLGLQHFGYAMGPHLPVAAGYGVLTWVTDLWPGSRLGRRPGASGAADPVGAGSGAGAGATGLGGAGTGPGPAGEPPLPTGLMAGQGRVRGTVRDKATGAPVAGASVQVVGAPVVQLQSVIAGERGEYKTAGVPAGVVRLEVTAPGYEPWRREVTVAAGAVSEQDAVLVARRGRAATLRVDVVDDKGQPIAAQVVLVRDRDRVDAPPDIAGGFLAQAQAGTWVVHVDSDGYASREQAVTLLEGAQQGVTVALHRRSAAGQVKLGPDYLSMNGSVTFQSGTADLRQTSLGLLNEVADVMLKHPEVKRVRIEGHTDNAGPAELNRQISEDRAVTVKNYLVQQGVAADRLETVGYGATQPLVPNMNPQLRSKNRRVVFKILERE